MFAVRLPREINFRLARLARRTGRGKSSHAREAILTYLDDVEDLYLAEQVKRRLDSAEEHTLSLDDIEARLGLTE